MKYKKSPLNYIGGKFKLLDQIIPLLPTDIELFIDLFAGGCNLGLNVMAVKTVCNDNNFALIEMYNYIKENEIHAILKHIEGRIDEFNLSKTNKEGYLNMRRTYNETKHPLDLFVCISFSFNNQIRFNNKGEFNMPFGKNRSSFNKRIKERLIEFNEISKNIKFECSDFNEMIMKNIHYLTNKDFIYCDPPYLITLASYNENGGWTEEMEKKLLKTLDLLDSKGIRFALSNVLESKGEKNLILSEWSKKYNIHFLNYSYKNSNYQRKNDIPTSTEVLITNF